MLTHTDTTLDIRKLLNIEQPIYLTQEIKIPFHYNSFTVYFSSLSYQNPKKNHFSFKLEGFDTEWYNNVEDNFASYNNLPPGKYCLLVKGSNNDQQWNEETARLWIIITPPWYRSIWAYIVYTLCIMDFSLGGEHQFGKLSNRLYSLYITQKRTTFKKKISEKSRRISD